MVLLKDGRGAADTWRYLDDDEELPPGPIIVSMARWQRNQESLSTRNMPLGLQLDADAEPTNIADDLHRFSVICLQFESFTDGRPYSQARLLRERYRYRGELRARGNILRDQFDFMRRCGIDALEVTKEADALAWRDAVAEIDVYYQPAGDTRPTVAMYRRGAAASYPV
jgi:uncharacterized protein (DUF934 family)